GADAEKEATDAARHDEEARAAVAREESELERLAASLSQKQSARDQAKETLGEAEHRQGALSEVLRRRENNVQALRESLTRAGLSELGRLADRLRPARGWEDAVDLLLGEELDALITPAEARAAATAARDLPSASFARANWTGAGRS